MAKIDLGRTLGATANLAVVVSIAFLAFEISQNNKQLRAQAEFNYMQARAETRERIATDPEFAEFFIRAISGQELSDVDKRRFTGLTQATLLRLEWEYAQTIDGNLPNDRASLREKWRSDWRLRFAATDGQADLLHSAWAELRSSLRSDFVEFFEQEIIGAE